MSKDTQIRLQREPVLILSHPDGQMEVFGENVSVFIARVPQWHSIECEGVAEDIAEMMLPHRYRQLHRRDRLRAVGSTRPLKPSTIRETRLADEMIHTLNRIGDMAEPLEGAGEAAAKRMQRARRMTG